MTVPQLVRCRFQRLILPGPLLRLRAQLPRNFLIDNCKKRIFRWSLAYRKKLKITKLVDQKLPDDGKITALSLTGLGLGPRHDGSTASTVPVPAPDPPGTVVTPQSTTPPEFPHR